jgi:hypothetical protein
MLFTASGGTIYYNDGYIVHVFTESGTLVCTGGPITAEVLVIGGGGAGGSRDSAASAPGGGAGALLTGEQEISGSMTVTVGDGGAAPSGSDRGENGEDSVFGDYTAPGGGGGGSYNTLVSGADGGCGGGGYEKNGAGGTGSVGYDGGPGWFIGDEGGASTNASGGGGGMGGAGENPGDGGTTDRWAGDGGAGLDLDFIKSGEFVGYCGGGAGNAFNHNGVATHGGGYGDSDELTAAGRPNTGGGGSGAGDGSAPPYDNAGNGGSGLVVIKYTVALPPVITAISINGDIQISWE